MAKMSKRYAVSMEVILKVYELAKTGMRKSQIAQTIGMTSVKFASRLTKNPKFKEAFDRGRDAKENVADKTQDFMDYIYRRMAPENQALFDEIMEVDLTKSPIRQIDALLRDKGKRFRQNFFLHAFVASNFNASEAMRRVGISYTTLSSWAQEPGFQELLDEIQYHKKNFFEAALCGLVAQGDSAAVIFANRTLNRDRGYNPTTKIELSGNIEHVHRVQQLDQLGLSLSAKRELLRALRKKQDEVADEDGIRMIGTSKKETVFDDD